MAHTMWWRGTPLAGATRWCGGPGPPTGLPLRILVHPENLRRGGVIERYSAATTRRKPQREKKLSGREKSAGGIPSRRGKIVAIVIVIELGFIGIIIIIISTTEHHHPHHATPFRCNILGRILSSS